MAYKLDEIIYKLMRKWKFPAGNILVFDKGEIVQMRSHDSLAAQKSLYHELWEAQAQYYT